MTDIVATGIKLFDHVGHSPAWPLVHRAVIELEDSGLGFPQFQPPAWNDGCLVDMLDDGAVRGFLAYRYDDARCAWFILLAYTSPLYRRKGVHTGLFNALVDRGKTRGDILAIDCGTHVRNIAAQKAFRAQGREETAIMFTYRLKGFDAGKDPLDVPTKAT